MANYCVTRWEKYTRADVAGLQKEANREADDPAWYKNDVDLSRSRNNIYLMRCNDWRAEIDSIIQDAGVKERPDSIVMVGGLYTASKEWMDKATNAQKMEYFQRCLAFERTRTTVFSAVIHRDEAGEWHMQTAGVPIVDAPDMQVTTVPRVDRDGNPVLDADGKPKMREKRVQKVDENGVPMTHRALSAKTLFGGKAKMSNDQTAFWKMCGEPMGLDRGECRVGTGEHRRHLSEREYALAAQQAEIDAKQAAVMQQAATVENAAKSVETARNASSGPDPEDWIETLKMPRMARTKLAESWRDYKHDWQSARNHEINEAARAKREMERLRVQAEAEAAARRAEAERRKREAEEAERQKLNRWMDEYEADLERQKRKAEAHNAAVDARRSAPSRPRYTNNISVDYGAPQDDGPELG